MAPSTAAAALDPARVADLVAAYTAASRITSGFCAGLNADAAAFAQAFSDASDSVSAFLASPEGSPLAGVRLVYLSDGSFSADTTSCDDAALRAANDLARLFDEEVHVLRIECGPSHELTLATSHSVPPNEP